MTLSPEQIADFGQHGFISPIDVLTPNDASALLEQFERAETEFPDQLHAEHRNNAHLVFPFLADVVVNPVIVSAVQSLVGASVVLGSTVLFVKEPNSPGFVSWHQDATYMALEPDNFVTAWLALTRSDEERGCVTVLPGTHTTGRREHSDRLEKHNILTRGQTIDGIDESSRMNLVLEPGQMSLHHPWLIHRSQPNRSDGRRIGFAMQSFFGSDVRPTRGEHHVMHIAGEAPAPEFVVSQTPTETCSDSALAARKAANAAMADVLYDGAAERRLL